MNRTSLIAALLVVGCRAAPVPAPSPQNPTPDDVAPAPDPQPATTTSAAPQPQTPSPVKLELDKPAPFDEGVTVTWSVRSHKHGRGFTTAIYGFEFADGSTTEDVEFRTEDDLLSAQGRVFDRSFTIDGGYDGVSITLIADRQPLTRDDADALLQARFEEAGLTAPMSGSSVRNGRYEKSWRNADTLVAEGSVGLFTHDVEFIVAGSQ